MWGEVDSYKESLQYIASKPEAIQEWENDKKEEARKWLEWFKTAEGRENVVTLSREDGR